MKIDISGCDTFQQDVINELSGRNIVVGASAGAGKTRVLVTRIMKRIIQDRIPITRIMALTFTAAAAEEMKTRLSEELYKLRASSSNAEETAYIEDQIIHLTEARITTIDAWCLSVIKKYYSVIGLDPAAPANVISEGVHTALFREAFDSAFAQLAETDRQDLADLVSYCSPRPEDYSVLFETVQNVITHAESSEDPDDWYRKAEEQYVPFKTIRQLPETIRTAFFAMLERKCRDLKTTQERILTVLEETPDSALKKEMMTAGISRLNDCIRCLADQDYPAYYENMLEFFVIKEKKPKNPELIPLHAAFRTQVDALLAITYPQETFAANSAYLAKIVRTLIRLARMSAEGLARLMRENTCMYFSDMERLALEILQADGGRVAEKIHRSLDEIMVDEFQDTSVLQDKIIRMIAKDTPIFRVGDVKQSIYRFRQARPQLMRDLMKDPDNAVFSLRYNYRSNTKIVEFSNLLFARLMNIEGIQDAYTEEDNVSAGSDRQKTDTETPHTHLILLKSPDQELTKEGKPKALPSHKAKALKSAWIAEKILSLHETKGMRWGSFAVLTKSHDDQRAVRSAMERLGIPYDMDTKEGFYQSDLCLDILSLLRYLNSADDDLSLTAVLTSPLFAFSDEEVAQLKLSCGSLRKGLRTRYPDLSACLDTLDQTAREEGTYAMLSLLARTPVRGSDTAWYDAVSEKDRANFDYLCELILAADSDDILSVMRQIDISSDEKSSEAVTVGADDDTVTASTIHHSKGLQYDCVFLWGTGSSRGISSASPVQIDDDLMIGLKDINPGTRIVLPTIHRLCTMQKTEQEDLEEFTRLLYVAVTRAKDQLYIVDMESSARDFRSPLTLSDLEERKGITGLITAALDHTEGITEHGLLETVYEEFTPSPAALSKAQKEAPAALPRFTLSVDLLPDILTPSSLERPLQEVPGLPPLREESSGGALYGTRMHALMEELPDDAEWTAEFIRSFQPDAEPSMIASALEFAASDLYQKAKTMEIHKEFPFYYEDKAVRINGTMDFAAIGADEILLVDFKTDRKTPEEILHAYTPQLNAYRKVLKALYPGRRISAYAWSFHNHSAIKIPE
ncbi:MAG: UvrD-helicase domain-containing protein [Solobacterium sp.]|nr:UvrD-helicase domain-containing protein [Solobacterium sp.]